MSWPAGRAPVSGPGPGVEPMAAPGTYPVAAGEGIWRLLLLARPFVDTAYGTLGIAELTQAVSRRLEMLWNQPAKLTFTVDGRSSAAQAVVELMTDVMAMRWDDTVGREVSMFRGVVTQSEDQLTEDAHSVNFVCQDYSAMLARRLFTTTYNVVQRDQDSIAADFVTTAKTSVSSSGTGFAPGSYLPLVVQRCNPDGSARGALSGQLRDRTYLPSTEIGQSLADLAAVIGGFDYDVLAAGTAYGTDGRQTNYDLLRIFYPYQGVTRSAPALVYGSTVSSLTRTVTSGDYANYWRVIGNNGSSDPSVPQLYAEAWNSDTNNVTSIPIGLWMGRDDASDVTIQSTLNDKAQGDLALNGILVPSYTVNLRPGVYAFGAINMGDVLPLVIQAGRLNVNTTVRVLGITYDIGDDGQEDVSLTVGRPEVTLPQLLRRPLQDTAALTRR